MLIKTRPFYTIEVGLFGLNVSGWRGLSSLLELQSRFGDKPLKFQVSWPLKPLKRDCSPSRVNRGAVNKIRHRWDAFFTTPLLAYLDKNMRFLIFHLPSDNVQLLFQSYHPRKNGSLESSDFKRGRCYQSDPNTRQNYSNIAVPLLRFFFLFFFVASFFGETRELSSSEEPHKIFTIIRSY